MNVAASAILNKLTDLDPLPLPSPFDQVRPDHFGMATNEPAQNRRCLHTLPPNENGPGAKAGAGYSQQIL